MRWSDTRRKRLRCASDLSHATAWFNVQRSMFIFFTQSLLKLRQNGTVSFLRYNRPKAGGYAGYWMVSASAAFNEIEFMHHQGNQIKWRAWVCQ